MLIPLIDLASGLHLNIHLCNTKLSQNLTLRVRLTMRRLINFFFISFLLLFYELSHACLVDAMPTHK